MHAYTRVTIHPRLAGGASRCTRLEEEHEQERRLRDRYRAKWESKFRANRVPPVSIREKSFLLFPILLCTKIFYVDFFSVVVKWNIGDVFFFFFWLKESKGI